ncbi:hypothetical protein OK016_24120 [Vibrio chagasii]|nr:hypothetical protein [Vibrio chagasii]
MRQRGPCASPLANLEEAQYANITKAMNAVMQSYVERYQAAC